ncbi:Mitochondrial import inner membrane translocase subunit tim8 [Didymosphaeria variabile]|uniref:Mitochondrial import inner membrane translocase subunit tim8 n=1 Tax=Didymosphaeria variabile TaxID=1932322 RepID=A0A9W9CB46_9PLEO|nr:Mitochondrial import inner membrane translocase subunit tim8 [Didymosphaeria variabile]KAJ4353617.1 Mitochondrial import inner membrane translocase subunit tim8 [Didymosphaeria variabile]
MKFFVLLAFSLVLLLTTAFESGSGALQHASLKNNTARFRYGTVFEKRGSPSESELTLEDIESTCSEPSISNEEVFNDARLKGRQLASGMVANSYFLPHIMPLSPWDGELRAELQLWGWAETERPEKCDFRNGVGRLGLETAFANLVDVRGIQGINPRPSNEGSGTVCHLIRHYDSPAVLNRPAAGHPWPPRGQQVYNVNAREYTVTGAFFTIAVNRAAGLIAFIDRRSPVKAAEDLWNRKPSDDELPALRATSDVAWGLWNRRQGPDNPGLGRIKYFLIGPIVNYETTKIIMEICDEDRAPLWPGLDFNFPEQQALALLGSPNGRAVGFFLAQHKIQMGGKYFVSKVKLFNSDAVPSYPYALFTVQRIMITEDILVAPKIEKPQNAPGNVPGNGK